MTIPASTGSSASQRRHRLNVALLGLWMPVAQTALFASRFGHVAPDDVNLVQFLLSVVLFYLVGCLSAMTYLSSLKRHAGRKVMVTAVYIPFMVFGLAGALLGGLLGPIGVLIGGSGVFVLPWSICRLIPSPRL